MPGLGFIHRVQCAVSPMSPPSLSLMRLLTPLLYGSIAKDRSWFDGDYVPFESEVSQMYGGGPMSRVVGIGTVLLPTKRTPSMSGPAAHTTLRLKNVLHVPDTNCNILAAGLIEDDRIFLILGKGKNKIQNQDGEPIAYLRDLTGLGLKAVRLSGPPVGPRVGPSLLEGGLIHIINATWSGYERQRWVNFKAEHTVSTSSSVGVTNDSNINPPFNDNEKEWLKKHFGGEFRFLQIYGLSIYKDEDRAEGRQLVRVLMHVDADDSHDEKNDEVDMENESEEDNFEDDDGSEGGEPTVLLANSYFNTPELAFIKRHYGDSVSFMLSFGLKFYNLDDGEEAQKVVQAMMLEH